MGLKTYTKVVGWTYLVFGIISIIGSIVATVATVLSACLIQGARTRNVRLVKPWIVLTGISLVPGLGLVIFALIKLPMQFTLHCITMWVCTSYCLKMVWLYKAEVEADNGLRGYL